MTLNHLFSPSLFYELFQHDIVACDGRILASDEGFQKYREFLKDRSMMKTTQIFQERKAVVDKLQSLMKTSIQTTKDVEILLEKLNLRMTEEGTVTLRKVIESEQDLAPSHTKRSLFEKQVAARKASLKVQRRDLKHLDGWLERISGPRVRIKRAPEKTKLEWKNEEFKYRAKVECVLKEMAKGRHIFAKKCHDDIQYKWISTMERILRNIDESKKVFRVSLKGDKRTENVLDPVKGDKGPKNILDPLKDSKEAESSLSTLKGVNDVENILASSRDDTEKKNDLDPSGTESEKDSWPLGTGANNSDKAMHHQLSAHGVETEDIITELGREEIQTEDTSGISPVNDKNDKTRCIPETEKKTDSLILIAKQECRRNGELTEKTGANSQVNDEEESVQRVTEARSKAENWILVAGSEREIAEVEQEESRREEGGGISLGDEDDNVQRIPETEIKTENSIPIARLDSGIADYGRDRKRAEETISESLVEDEDKNVRRISGTGSKTENRILVIESEEKIGPFGHKGYREKDTSSESSVDDKGENVRRVPETGIEMEDSIEVAGPKEIDAENEEMVTLDLGRRTVHYRKATSEEDSRTEGSSDTSDNK